MSCLMARLKLLWQLARGCLSPTTASKPHIVCFDIKSTYPKGIFTQESVKIPVDKSPVEAGIETNEDRCLMIGSLLYPMIEISHRFGWRMPSDRQLL